MAFRSSSGTTYATRTSTTITAPTGITDDDILVLVALTADFTEAPDPTPPTGFTLLTSTNIFEYALDMEVRVYWKLAASESGNYTFTNSSCSTQGVMLVFSGRDTTDPFGALETTNTGTGQTTTATGLTTAADDSDILFVGSDFFDNSNNLTPPTGTTPTFTERFDNSAASLYAATGILATAGATGNKSHSNKNGNGTSPFAAHFLALKPAGALPITPTGASVAVTPGTLTVVPDQPITPTGASVSVTPGTLTVVEDKPITPTGASVTVTAGSLTVEAALMAVSVVSFNATSTLQTNTTPKTVTGLSWSSGDVIVVAGGCEASTGVMGTPTNANLTFTLRQSVTDGGSNESPAWVWTAVAGSAQSSQTISAAKTGFASVVWGFGVWVLTGTDDYATGFSSRSESAQSLTTSTGSAVVFWLSDWNASNPPDKTPSTGSGTATERLDAGNGSNWAHWAADWVGTTAGTTTYGPNNFTSLQVGQVAVEITAAAGALPITPTGASVSVGAGTLTVAAGAVAVTPAGASVAVTPGTLTVVEDQQVSPTGASVSVAAGSLAVAAGAVGVTLVGASVAAVPGNLTVATVPDAVVDLDCTPGNTEVVLTWSAPADGGSAITDYIVQYRPVGA